MKHLIKSAILAGSILVASCQPVAASEYCLNQANMSGIALSNIQKGIPNASLINAMATNEMNTKETNSFTGTIVHYAYSKENLMKDSVDFSIEVYGICAILED